jgi:hypothetical protein
MRGAWRNEPNPEACKVDIWGILTLLRVMPIFYYFPAHSDTMLSFNLY